MAPLGTLNVSDDIRLENRICEEKFNTFNVPISVKKPDFELLQRVERVCVILLLFEILATLVIINVTWNWCCALFLIPMLFRWAAFPTSSSITHSLPSFILLHSMIIAVEAAVMIAWTYVSVLAMEWKENSEWMVFLFGFMSAVLIIRFFLAIVQQKQYNRIWMSHVLSERSYFFTIV
ncbi:unnamed protein product [Caenorhabditis sp. 36 PRJEB53466]|nr:unnamed protein product [Caenorhabditis sp. 36 PRJEB53466]